MTVEPSDFAALDAFEDVLPVQALLTALSRPVARYSVYYISEESPVSLDQLADVVTGWVNASTGRVATRSDRDRIELLLYHVYLPVLDSLGVVQFEVETRTIRIDPSGALMERFVEWFRGLE